MYFKKCAPRIRWIGFTVRVLLFITRSLKTTVVSLQLASVSLRSALVSLKLMPGSLKNALVSLKGVHLHHRMTDLTKQIPLQYEKADFKGRFGCLFRSASIHFY